MARIKTIGISLMTFCRELKSFSLSYRSARRGLLLAIVSLNILPLTQADALRGAEFYRARTAGVSLTAAPANYSVNPGQGFTLSAVPGALSIVAGQSAAATVKINRTSYQGPVYLEAEDLPEGFSVVFDQNPAYGSSAIMQIFSTTRPVRIGDSRSGNSPKGGLPGIDNSRASAPWKSAFSGLNGSNGFITSTLELGRISNACPDQLSRKPNDGGTICQIVPPIQLRSARSPSLSTEPGIAAGKRIANPRKFVQTEYCCDFFVIKIKGKLYPEGPEITYRMSLSVNCSIDWVGQFGSTTSDDIHQSGTGDTYQSLAVDINGNIYVAGDVFYQGSHIDVLIAKYNKFGQKLWVNTFTTPGLFEDRPLAVAVDNAGNVFLGGYTNGTFPNNSNLGGYDFWIAKYDPSGAQQDPVWVKQGGGIQEDGANGFEIVPDGAGGGKFTTFENDRRRLATYSFTSAGSLSYIGGLQISATFSRQPWDIAFGPGNTVVIVGGFDNGSGKTAYLAVYDGQTGMSLFSDTFQVLDSSIARRVVVDNAGKIYVAGTTRKLAGADQSLDAWVRIYDTSYQSVQKRISSANNDDFINALIVDSNGDLFVAGKTSGVLGASSGGGSDAWIGRLHGGTAETLWLHQFPVSQDDSFEAATPDANGGVILAGHTLEFDSATGTRDALLMRYQVQPRAVPPVVTGFRNPMTGQPITSARAGDTVRIIGGFGLVINLPTISNIHFNGVPASFTQISGSAIDAVVPQGATTGQVTVTKWCYSVRSPAPLTITP